MFPYSRVWLTWNLNEDFKSFADSWTDSPFLSFLVFQRKLNPVCVTSDRFVSIPSLPYTSQVWRSLVSSHRVARDGEHMTGSLEDAVSHSRHLSVTTTVSPTRFSQSREGETWGWLHKKMEEKMQQKLLLIKILKTVTCRPETTITFPRFHDLLNTLTFIL